MEFDYKMTKRVHVAAVAVFLLAVSVLRSALAHSDASKPILEMRADETLFNLQLADGETLTVYLHDLAPRQSYELRVSYPATIPTDFFLTVATQMSSGRAPGRRLLNIEKIVFMPSEKPYQEGRLEYFARVTARRTGVTHRRDLLLQPVTFNLSLETLYSGLPFHVWQSTVVIFVGLVCVVLLMPYIRRLIYYTIERALGKHSAPPPSNRLRRDL